MKKALSIIAVFFFLCPRIQAETMKWLVQPEYEQITYYSLDIFKCKTKNHLILLDWHGKPLLDQNIIIDSITDYTEGYALALKQENSGYKIMGFLSEEDDHQFHRIEGDYFTTSYSFFSEGFIVVSNGKGKMGYLNETGRCVIDCKYTNARPFRKGFASVNENNRSVLYINRQGKTKNPISFHGGKIDKGSSFNDDGEAIVRHEKECVIINREMQVVRSWPYSGVFPIRTFDYAYSEDYVNPVPSSNQKPVPDKQFGTFERMAKCGYNDKTGAVLLPAQFNVAGPICNGCAIASIDDKFGVLKLIEGGFTSVCSTDLGQLIVYPGMKCRDVEYDIQVPIAFDKNELVLLLDKGDGQPIGTALPAAFQPIIKDQSCVIKTTLQSSDGLLLWEEKKELDVAFVHVSATRPSAVTSYAMENGIQQVKTTITNHSDIEVVVNPSFTVSLDHSKKNSIESESFCSSCRLLPGQKKELFINIKVKENELVNAKISVAVDGFDCDSCTSRVQLKKI